MLALVLAAAAVAAPPPKPAANTGRITLWVGDTCEHFKPDGGDVTPVKLPEGVGQPRHYGLSLTADRKYVVYLDYSPQNTSPRLTVTPLGPDAAPYALSGYVVNWLALAADGTRAYFSGIKGDEFDAEKMRSAPGFVLDLATKKVEPLALPEKHGVEAVAPDGKTFLTSRLDVDNTTVTRKTYLLLPGGKPLEILKANVFTPHAQFSPGGTKVVLQAVEYTDLQPAGNGGFRIGGTKPRENVVLDVATRKTTPVRNLPADGNVNAFAWSPDGSQLAYLWCDPRARGVGIPVQAPGGGVMQMNEYELKVFVADADGGSPKEVYKVKAPSVRAFQWR